MTDFKDILQALRRRKGVNQEDLAVFVGVSRVTISDYERGRSEPDIVSLKKIATFFEISIDELLGNAHLIQKKEEPKKHENAHPNAHLSAHLITANEPKLEYVKLPKVVTVDSQGRDNIVLVPAKARAGYLSGYGDQEFIQNLPAYRLPGLNHGTFRMFEVEGHSMIPTFHESDIMVCRYMESFAEIRDNRAHVVVSQREGVVVKRVVNRIQRDGKIILNSDNQRHSGEYPPIIMNPEEVLEIWYVVAYMSRQMRAPGELYNRLIDVESRLTLMEDAQRKLPRK
jgi:transcriptional regulator with XRE-family HTH domain